MLLVMNKFRGFLMGMSVPDRDDFAARCGTSAAHLRNIAYGQKSCAEKLAIEIERESRGEIRCEDLRPDVDWAYLRGTSAVNPKNPSIPERKAA